MRPFVEELSRICKFRVGVNNAGLPSDGNTTSLPGIFRIERFASLRWQPWADAEVTRNTFVFPHRHKDMARMIPEIPQESSFEALLEQFYQSGIENLMARDPPQESEHFQRLSEGFAYAVELIESIRALNEFCIGAAWLSGGPRGKIRTWRQTSGIKKAKVDAGAELLELSAFSCQSEFFLKWRHLSLPVREEVEGLHHSRLAFAASFC